MKNGEAQFEDDIPIPPRTRRPKYAWGDMKVGQSLFLPNAKTLSAVVAAKKATGGKFQARHVEGGVRVWRME